MTEHVGNQLQARPSTVRPGGPGVTQHVSSHGLDAAAGERTSHDLPHIMRGQRAATGNVEMHKERSVLGRRTPPLQIIEDGSGDTIRQWYPSFSSHAASIPSDRRRSPLPGQLVVMLRSIAAGHANFIAFIDPHLDPTKKHYLEFVELLLAAHRNHGVGATIEIHRKFDTEGNYESRFHPVHEPLLKAGLGVNVFIWDDFHDRYFISNLIGILMPNGFDVSRKTDDTTTWARISREGRVDVQSEFDCNSNRHHLVHRFQIGRQQSAGKPDGR